MFFAAIAKTLKLIRNKNQIFDKNNGIISKLMESGQKVCWNGSTASIAVANTEGRKEILSSLISRSASVAASASASVSAWKSASAGAGLRARPIPARTSLLFSGFGGSGGRLQAGIPFRSIFAPLLGSSSSNNLFNYSQVRCVTYGREYQPNTLKRKRSVGFLARLKSIGGRKILKRRMMKGRRYLTH